jgi:molecular chaperone GrpE
MPHRAKSASRDDLAGDAAEPSGEAAPAVEEQPPVEEPAPDFEAQCEEYRALAQRVQADFENYKKRTLREHTHLIERAGERLIAELLPVVDDLDRTLAATSSEETEVAAEHLADAIRLVREKLLGVFSKEGVEVIDRAGEHFDPNVEEAMMQTAREDLDEDTVVEVYQKGYKLGDRLLRPAKVVVSHRP